MSAVLPFTFTGGVGHKARASEVNANFAILSGKFTESSSGIKNEDISSSAAIRHTKLSSVSGDRITQAELEDNAVDSRILKDDPGTGHAAAAVSLADHIKDAIITNEKLVDGTIKKPKLNMPSVLVSIPAIIQAGVANVDTGLTLATANPTMFWSEGVGLPGGSQVDIRLHLNTSDNKFYLNCVNMNIGGANSPTFNVRVYYLAI